MTSAKLASMLLTAACILCSHSDKDSHKKKILYSYSCLDSAAAGNKITATLDKAGELLKDMLVNKKEITDEMQSDYGEAFHRNVTETKAYIISKDAAIRHQLHTVLNNLLSVRENPTAIKYEIYLTEDTAINAFTFGGRIYITRAIYDKCKVNESLLYAIIGHEIGHSEKEHIKQSIHSMMAAKKILGENGITALEVIRYFNGAFNQKNELEADYYGVNLCKELNKNLCSIVSFWKDMSAQETEYSLMEDFFRTHPYSALRSKCLKDHILRNFNINCK